MKENGKGKYAYKGYIITKNPDNNYWCVTKKNPKNWLERILRYQANTLRNCKNWINNEVNAQP